jgi:ribose transport system permease protein
MTNLTADTPVKKRTFDLSAISELAPFIGFVLIAVFFFILTDGKIFSPTNLKSLTNQVLITALVGIGAVFVFGAGAFDMSMSRSVGLTAIIGAKVAMATGSIAAMVMVCLVVALALGLLKGLLAAYVDVPFFIVTIVIGTLLGALGLVVMGTETVLSVTQLPTIEDMTLINIITLGGFYLAGLLLFNYTKIGKSCKLIGGNEVAARQSGINIEKTKIIAFLIAAVGVALAATIILLRTKTASPTTGGTIGIDIMVALVLGGMPLSGGPRSKISAALVGAAAITVLNSGLIIIGVSTGMIQIFRGVIFLTVVLIASLNYRTQLLPR